MTNKKDLDQLSGLAIKSKEALEIGQDELLTVLADKGYYKGEQIELCHQTNIDTLISPRNTANSKKDVRFQKNKFTYDYENDLYICPEGNELKTNGKYCHQSQKGRPTCYWFKRYTLKYSVCSACPYAPECAGGKLKQRQGKSIDDQNPPMPWNIIMNKLLHADMNIQDVKRL